ncbi:HAD-IIB family hydrolase [Nitratireductor mangrovi]|uniref:HAD-IIB family hydrolase n=1 Tax=Nitratireductor mangrovi TaxID=2599600 RepID=A0A5B8KUK7_9HYPH|nr:HAD-IIB family hydrolase [Nitratireductor mangrovi]QDY99326.1 HAD-IIB family hydrolase [Nitratireductor mangrovi]
MIVFSDLDGTLLDHESYDHHAALPALAALAARAVPVVVATSKTAAEVGPILARLGLDTPAIVENGGGIAWPKAGAADAEPCYGDIRACLDALPGKLKGCFAGFGDMDARRIAALTGLGRADAARAADRAYSEPGLFSGTDAELTAFRRHLAGHGLSAVRGGRFLTISRGVSKAKRMNEVRAMLERRDGRRYHPLVALGDAENDRDMLEAADLGVVVANPAHEPLAELDGEADGRIIRTELPGPMGWNAAIIEILRRLSGPDAEGVS